MEMRAALGKDRESPVIVILRAGKILLKMNSNGQIKSKRQGISLLVSANFPPSLISSLLLLIWPLEFIFYKILPALNIMMTDSLFLPKTTLISIYLF